MPRGAARPFTSAATLAAKDAQMTTFVPDVRGTYEITLDVFDGELWSERPAFLNVVAE